MTPGIGCGTPPCPQPPISTEETRSPYCPNWISKLTGAVVGRLMVVANDCLYLFNPKCSGVLFYDATTEQVAVVTPPFVSSAPRETRWGFIAKAVTTVRNICVEGQQGCVQEIHRELGAQMVERVNCGDLAIITRPLCGDLPADQSADADQQARIDILNPIPHEDLGCPDNIRWLVATPSTRGVGQNAVACNRWSLMRRLRMLGSQWGFISKDDAITAATAKQVVVVPVAGGKEGDPCYELRVLERVSNGFPDAAENCDIMVYKGKGTSSAGWKAEQKGLSFHPGAYKDLLLSSNVGTLASFTIELPDYPTSPCGEVWAQLEIVQGTAPGPSGSLTTLIVRDKDTNQILSYCGYKEDLSVSNPMCKTKPDGSLLLSRSKGGTGTSSLYIRLVGYWY